MPPVLTERLIVRRMSPGDLDDFLAYQTHPEVMRYQPYEPATPERAARFLAKMAVAAEPGDEGAYLAFAVEHRGEDRMIGEVSIEVFPKAQSRGGLGWSFHPDYHGRGYALEAARVLLEHGFGHLGLRRLTTFCDVRNVASWRLMERLGMRREGHTRQSMLLRGEWQDEYHYALLQGEWLAQQSGGTAH